MEQTFRHKAIAVGPAGVVGRLSSYARNLKFLEIGSLTGMLNGYCQNLPVLANVEDCVLVKIRCFIYTGRCEFDI